jgi:DNA binding domain, excisionase family
MNYLTIREISQILNVNEETVRRWIRNGTLPAKNLGGRTGYRISSEDFEIFKKENKLWGVTKNDIAVSRAVSSAVVGKSIAGSTGTTIHKYLKAKGIRGIIIIPESPSNNEEINHENTSKCSYNIGSGTFADILTAIAELDKSIATEKLAIEERLRVMDNTMKLLDDLRQSIDNKFKQTINL